MPKLLVVDSEASVRLEIRAFLTSYGFEIQEAHNTAAAVNVLRTSRPDLAIVDYRGDAARRRDLLVTLRKVDERVPIILLVDGEEVDVGVQGVRDGADHYVQKPLDLVALLMIVRQFLERQRTRRRSIARNVLERRHDLDPFVGESAAISRLSEQAHLVLGSHTPVLLQGETGTGKGVLANWLHQHGPRAEEAFVDINCAGLSREFLESELFGHERGAFTGAAASKLGLLDLAHHGTAFLDEIGEIDLQLQPRLLKVLEEKRFRRLGDVRDHSVDIRLIAATNRDLGKRSREGTFRADLYYRINTISLTLPPLRERKEDIPLLARNIANSLGHDIDFTNDAVRSLQAYDWPGNVRELRNVIERAILISNRAQRIGPGDLRFEMAVSPHVRVDDANDADDDAEEPPGTLVEAERRHIERVLKFEQGSVERAAVRLGVSRSTLYQKLRRFGIGTKLPPEDIER